MRALNIIGIISSLGIFWYGMNVINEIQELIENSYFSYGNHTYTRMSAAINNIGFNGAFVMMLVGFTFLGFYIANLNKIKRLTVKVISILGIIASAVFLLVNVIYLGSIDHNFFPVAYVTWWLYGLLCLSFTIVLLVQAVRDHTGDRRILFANDGDDVLDDFDDLD